MLFVGKHIHALDYDSDEQYKHKFSEVGFHNVVCKRVQGHCCCIGRTKGHYLELIVPFMDSECHLWRILSTHVDLIISSFDIQLGEDGHAMELI